MKIKTLIALTLAAMAIAGILYFQSRQSRQIGRSFFLFSSTKQLVIRDDYRQGISFASGSILTREFTVPTKGKLAFSFGIPKDQWNPSAEPFIFTISLNEPQGTIIFKKELRPSSNKEDRHWKEATVDLSTYEHKKIRLQILFQSQRINTTAFLSQAKVISPEYEKQKYNVLLITIDTLRKDHVSAYGYKRETTPALDTLARKSSLFMKAYSNAPLTVPSVVSLMTSRYPSQHQVPNNASRFDKSTPVLASLLKQSGFSTAAFVGNAVLRPNRNLDEGFDVYNAYLPSTEINRRLPERNAAQLTNAAKNWLSEHAEERFFLWLHYQDPHAPYTPPAPHDKIFDAGSSSGVSLPFAKDIAGTDGIPEYAKLNGVADPEIYKARYDAEIHFTDMNVADMFRTIEDRHLKENTMIIVTSDHGESLGEGNHYFAHGHNVTPELTDIPLIVYIPGKKPEVFHNVVESTDIAPTILRLLDITVPIQFQGKFLFQKAEGAKAISEQPYVRWAVIDDKGRYIYERTGDEQFHGEKKEEISGRKIVQDLIVRNIRNGCVLAFSQNPLCEFRVNSNQPWNRVFLFGSEKEDRLQIEPTSVDIHLHASGEDIDYVFLEPAPDADIFVEPLSLKDLTGRMISLPFRLSSIAVSQNLPSSADFASSGAIIVRIPGQGEAVEPTTEEKEELKALGYVQ